MNKVLHYLVVALLLVSLLAACAGPAASPTTMATQVEPAEVTKSTNVQKPTDAPNPTDAPEPTPAPQPVTLRFLEKNPENAKFWDENIPLFEKEFPNIKVEHEAIAGNPYPQILQTRLAADEVDLFVGEPQNQFQGGSESVQQQFLDFSDQAWLKRYLPDAIELGKLDGKVYLVPSGLVGTCVVFYNKTEADKLGLTPPTTWSEFLEFAQAFQKSGKAPIAMGLGDQWPIVLPYLGMEATLVRGANPDFWTDLKAGKTAFNGAEFLPVFEKVKTLSQYFQANAAGEAYENTVAIFAKGEAMMLVDGSWHAGALDQAAPVFEVGVFALPASDDAAQNGVVPAKLAHGYMINKNSPQPNIDAALTFLEWLSRPAVYQKYLDVAGYLTAQPGAQAKGQVATVVTEFFTTASLITNAEYLYWPGADVDFITYANEMLSGSKTPEAAAEAMQQKLLASQDNWK